jgi:hypothetical protein
MIQEPRCEDMCMHESIRNRVARCTRLAILCLPASIGLTACTESPADKTAAPAAQDGPRLEAKSDPEATATAAAPRSVAQGPRITLASHEYDFGRIDELAKVHHVFEFSNTGDAELRIIDTKTSCGCTAPALSGTAFGPGESGTVTVTFDPERRWFEQNKHVTLVTNDPDHESVRLEFTAYVLPFVEVNPKAILMGDVDMRKQHTRTITLTCNDPNMDVLNLATDNPHLSARMLEPADDDPPGTARVEVTLHDTLSWGRYRGNVNMLVRAKHEASGRDRLHEIQTGVVAFAQGHIIASKQQFVLGPIKQHRPFEYTVRLIADVPFTVLDTTISHMNRQPRSIDVEAVDVSQPDTCMWDITLRGNAGDLDGAFSGDVVITTDLNGEEELPIRFAGVVRAADG